MFCLRLQPKEEKQQAYLNRNPANSIVQSSQLLHPLYLICIVLKLLAMDML